MDHKFDLVLTTTAIVTLPREEALWALAGIVGRKHTRFELVLSPQPVFSPRGLTREQVQAIREPFGKGALGQATLVGDEIVSIIARTSEEHALYWERRTRPRLQDQFRVQLVLDDHDRVTALELKPFVPQEGSGAPAKPKENHQEKPSGKKPSGKKPTRKKSTRKKSTQKKPR